MLRYHKKVYFPEYDTKGLTELTEKFNNIEKCGYSKHCLDNLKYRAIDLTQVLQCVKDAWLDYSQIFEYYKSESGRIEKLCYRIKYNDALDLILVLNKDKVIITIYINSADDKHYILKENLYQSKTLTTV